MRIILLVCGLWFGLCGTAIAQERSFRLSVPETLLDSGFIKYLLPRFSLKTSVRITVVAAGAQADAAFGDSGVPVFKGASILWHLQKTDGPHTDRFHDWLVSDIGKRTIEAFEVDGGALFSGDVTAAVAVTELVYEGDTVLGETQSLKKCGRCHVINDSNRMDAIGSTPSFAVLRGFADWQGRFESFFVLKPHPAFTQIEEVTPPFGDQTPSPIVPIELTLDELDAIVAYVSTIEAADLGAPMQLQ
ncbi:MAG: hypothetical protein ACI9IV_001259 [Paracoccaceae bacterium]|jgi:hypothetical protein